MPSIDLNADLGEECADDAALLRIVTTANVATGAHAGGGEVLRRTVAAAVQESVAIGAHPSYTDRAGFGRASHLADLDDVSLAALVVDQSLAVAAACEAGGASMAHVKAHGALYHDVAGDPRAAQAFARGVAIVGRELGEDVAVMGPPASTLEQACRAAGLRFLTEAFADRAYLPDGRLAPRSRPGSVLQDTHAVVAQALSLVVEGRARAIDGSAVSVAPDTLCLHGDTPDAVRLAESVRAALEQRGITIARFAQP